MKTNPAVQPATAPLHVGSEQPELEHWSNLTLRRISEHDAGQYRCIARNKGGQVEANVSLQTPPAPVTILIEEETGLSSTAVLVMAIAGSLLLLTGLILLIVCLCTHRRTGRGKQVQRECVGAKLNGSATKTANGNGSMPVASSEQEKSLLEIEMDQHHLHHTSIQHSSSPDGYHAISQTDIDAQQHMQMQQLQLHHHHQQQQQLQLQQQLQQQQQQQRLMQGSNTYISAERFDAGSRGAPESLTRHLMMMDGSQVHQHQNPDGSFYPDLLDIPHRGARGGGSPSTHSGASNDASSQQQLIMTMPLSAVQLAGHPSYGGGAGGIHPPLQFTDSSSTTSSTAVLLPAGARPGYVTLPRRPRQRMPSWASSPPMSSSSPGPSSLPPTDEPQQPLYDTIGPRITADGSSTSALSLNKIAGLTPLNSAAPRHGQSSTLSRGHKISLPAYYVPIEEVDIPPASPMVQQRQFQQSTPNILSNGQYEDRVNSRHHEPVLAYFHNNNNNSSTPIRSTMDGDLLETQHLLHESSTPTSNNTSYSNAGPELISPIPDYRGSHTAGSRASVSSLNSNTTMRRKIAPAVPPKPGSGSIVVARPASIVPYGDGDSHAGSPAKVAPKPPPKPKKSVSTTAAAASAADDDGQAAYEDEGEDGTEV